MRKALVFFLMFLMASGGTGYAKDDRKETKTGKTTTEKNFTPIEIRQVGTDKRPSEEYYYNGEKLNSLQQFKTVIDPLNDPEGDRLLKTWANKSSTGVVFILIGGLAVAGGGVYAVAAPPIVTPEPYSTVPLTTQPDLAPAWILGAAGGVVAFIGFILEGEAGQSRQDAVKRYNHLVKPDQNLSMILMPQTNTPALELTQHF